MAKSLSKKSSFDSALRAERQELIRANEKSIGSLENQVSYSGIV